MHTGLLLAKKYVNHAWTEANHVILAFGEIKCLRSEKLTQLDKHSRKTASE